MQDDVASPYFPRPPRFVPQSWVAMHLRSNPAKANTARRDGGYYREPLWQSGGWSVFEDVPGKPGLIANRTGEVVTYLLRSEEAALSVRYGAVHVLLLKSYRREFCLDMNRILSEAADFAVHSSCAALPVSPLSRHLFPLASRRHMGTALIEFLSVNRSAADPHNSECGCTAASPAPAGGASAAASQPPPPACLGEEQATVVASKRVDCLWDARVSETVIEELNLPGWPAEAVAAAGGGQQQGGTSASDNATSAAAAPGAGAAGGGGVPPGSRALLPPESCVVLRISVVPSADDDSGNAAAADAGGEQHEDHDAAQRQAAKRPAARRLEGKVKLVGWNVF